VTELVVIASDELGLVIGEETVLSLVLVKDEELLKLVEVVISELLLL